MAILKALGKRTYLTFQLDKEIFAIDVQHVREVLEFGSLTKIPGVPDYVRGIINLRGGVVPVVDLRLKFGMSETVKTQNTCVIVLYIGSGDNLVMIGALADSVKEVFEFDSGKVEPPPRIGTLSNSDYIQGIGKRDDQFVIILNIKRAFSTDEIVLLGAAAEEDILVEDGEEERVTESSDQTNQS